MKRRFIVRLGLLMLAGAIVNVAVAWEIAVFHSSAAWLSSDPLIARVHDRYWALGRRDDLFCTILSSQVWHGFCTGCDIDARATDCIPRWSPQADYLRSAEAMPDFEYARTIATAFPLLAAWAMEQIDSWSLIAPRQVSIGKQIGVVGPSARILPIRPIWPGFAINTIFYAAMLWLLFAAPFRLRRWRRIRRGLCPACAYPIGENEVCTECGKAVQPQRGVGM